MFMSEGSYVSVLRSLLLVLQWFSFCGPGQAVSALSGNLLEIQMVRLYSTWPAPETLEVRPSNLCLNKSSR